MPFEVREPVPVMVSVPVPVIVPPKVTLPATVKVSPAVIVNVFVYPVMLTEAAVSLDASMAMLLLYWSRMAVSDEVGGPDPPVAELSEVDQELEDPQESDPVLIA